MKYHPRLMAAVWAVVVSGGLLALTAPVRADVTIDTGTFTVGATAGGNIVVTNWVGSPFTVTAPLLVGAAPANATGFGNNDVTISNFVITANAISYIGNGSSSNLVTLLANTTLSQGANNLAIGSGGTGNKLTINGGTVSLTAATEILFAGATTHGNSLVITNGGQFITGGSVVRYASTSSYSNSILVTGSGSVWSNSGALYDFGGSLGGDRITVADGGLLVVRGSEFHVGFNTGNETVIITDTGSVARIETGGFVGNSSAGSSLIVSNGGKLVRSIGGTTVGGSAGADRNAIIVTGPGSVFSNQLAGSIAALFIGNLGAASNRLVISQGGLVYNDGRLIIGNSGTAGVGNSVTVTGAGSVLTNTGEIIVGNFAVKQSSLTVSNGGRVFASTAFVGGNVGNNSDTNTITVTGAGSALTLSTGLSVANLFSGNIGKGNRVQILDGGLLEANSMTIFTGSTGNTISNVGGIFQFSQAAPTISPNGFGNIAVTDGTVAFRAITDANVWGNWGGTRGDTLTNISFAGANTFRLNAATNRSTAVGGVDQTYIFDTGLGATNYTRLELINGQTAYRNGDVTIGSGGTFLASNTLATITGTMTNIGAADIVNATVNFQSALQVAGTLTLRNGFVTGTASKTVGSTGLLRGDGSVVGNMTNNGAVAPGIGDLGTLVFSNDLTLAGSYQADFGDAGNDQLNVFGLLALTGATLNLNQVGAATSNVFVIASYVTLGGDGFFNTTTGLPVGYAIDYGYNGGTQIALVVVPEPSAMALVLGGLVLLILLGRHRFLKH